MAARVQVVIPFAYRDPLTAFAAVAGEPGAVLLDSGDSAGGWWGGWSVVAGRPATLVESTAVPVGAGRGERAGEGPLGLIRGLLERAAVADSASIGGGVLPPFTGGVIAVAGYEVNGTLERLPSPLPADLGWPDLVAGVYDTVALFDTVHERAFAAAPTEAAARALVGRLAAAPPLPPLAATAAAGGGPWTAGLDRAGYEARVARVVDYIFAGDAFQVNLSQRFVAPMPAGVQPFDLFRRLRALTPAPFAACLNCGGGRWLLSASPERFLRVTAAGGVETRPIKGTRPRGADGAEDAALAAALAVSVKDRAENLMIVDLLRNDLARVCQPGTIRVPQLCGLESFAAVHHLVSVVEGRLRAGRSALDLLAAAFPGGSITGAPKIRAMEIIRELEPCRRGPYCGSVVCAGFDGAMDSSIIIRSLVVGAGRVVAQAGGGIVADSDPAAEYDESMLKARALLAVIGGGLRGAP